MKNLILSLLLPLFIASCASNSSSSQKSTAASAPARKSMNERFGGGGSRDPDSFKRDSKGNFISNSGKRSPFENKGEASFAKKDFKTGDYKAGDFKKKSWWGNKDYDRKAYAGNTDGSKFQKTAAQQGQNAREASTSMDQPSDYKTGNYGTGAARESRSAGITKGSNDMIENRRKEFEQPSVLGWREQRSLTMEQSKGILGR